MSSSSVPIVNWNYQVNGLSYQAGLLDNDAQDELVQFINSQPWDTESISRATQHYGFKYPYNKKVTQTNQLEKTSPLPEIFNNLIDLMIEQKLIDESERPDQAIVNKYEVFESIGAHTDNTFVFGPTIVSISLLSSWIMNFHNKSLNVIKPVLLETGSAVVLRNEARYEWTHEIKKRKSDTLANGTKLQRDPRISITFRKTKQ